MKTITDGGGITGQVYFFGEEPEERAADRRGPGQSMCGGVFAGYRCTLATGHRGGHQAGGTRHQVIAEWEES